MNARGSRGILCGRSRYTSRLCIVSTVISIVSSKGMTEDGIICVIFRIFMGGFMQRLFQ